MLEHSERNKGYMKPELRIQRLLWSAVIVLALIGIAIVIRRTVNLVPILLNGYHPPVADSNPVAAQLVAGRAKYTDYMDTLDIALLASFPEALCTMDVFDQVTVPAELQAALTQRMLESLKCFGKPEFPYGI